MADLGLFVHFQGWAKMLGNTSRPSREAVAPEMNSEVKTKRGMRRYRFSGFVLESDPPILYLNGEMVTLRPKVLETLVLLVENAGELVTRETLVESIWPSSFVEESAVSRNIHEIRKTLEGLVPGEYVATIPKRGYRFVADVVSDEAPEKASTDRASAGSDHPETGSTPRVRWHLIAVVLICVGLMSSFALWARFGGQAFESNSGRNTRNIRSIAILPIRPLDQNEDAAIVSMGITDQLISKLADFDEFVVRPLSAIQEFDTPNENSIAIGRKLEVDAVLTGTFQQQGDRYRVNLRFWDIRSGSQLWTETVEASGADIFELQDRIALRVATDLISDLKEADTKDLTHRPTSNREAYSEYLRGRLAWNKRTAKSLRESVDHYRKAIEMEPSFALAYAGMADSYAVFNDYSVEPASESFPKAKAAALRALDLDGSLGEPHAALGYIFANYDWNYSEAEREYRKAIEIKPGYATAHQWYGEMLTTLGRFPEAIERLERAKMIDPLVPIIRSEIAVAKYYSGRYRDSIRDFRLLEREHPDFPTTYAFLSRNYEQMGNEASAIDEELQFLAKIGMNANRLVSLRDSYETGGKVEYLRSLAKILEEDASKDYVFEYRLVLVYGRLRDRGNVLKWLKRGVANRSSNIFKVYIDPNFRFLRSDPTFVELLKQMNLPVRQTLDRADNLVVAEAEAQ